MTKKQFELLCFIKKNGELHSQRKLAEQLGYSLGTINKALAELSETGLVKDGQLTQAGLDALEPYRVKRAVIIAAGFGSRMVPITLNTPKPLVRVHGKRIIDTILDALVAAEIEEIYLVRGYLGEQFDQLLSKYPMIRFIDNPIYNEANNISSVVCARELVHNAYVLEADLLLRNPDLITPYQFETNYLGIPVETTHDWCFITQKNIIKKMTIGGKNCMQMVGISYWSEEDGKKLCTDIVQEFEAPGGKERYWDQVALEYRMGNYEISTRPCRFEDIVEIDSFKELKQIDKSYDV